MNSRDLITALQSADPTGETEVAVYNAPIRRVERLPAYYDGALQVATIEGDRVIAYKVVRSGDKLQIVTTDLETCLEANPGLALDFSELDEARRREWEADAARIRAGIGEDGER